MPHKSKNTFAASSIPAEAFFAFSQVFPLALAMGICSPLGMIPAAAACIICPFLYLAFGVKPLYSAFAVILLSALSSLSAAVISAFVCAALMIAFSFFDEAKLRSFKKFAYPPALGAAMLGLALTMTVMQTTNYFGIGAVGNTVLEMLRSYRSLGFHGNWRGVLYGTIVLVIMITYPRKFKKLSLKIPAAFWSIVFTLPLNLWLNPAAESTAINEVGKNLFPLNTNYFSTLSASFGSITAGNIIKGIVGGIALFFILLYSVIKEDGQSRGCLLSLGIIPAVCSPLCPLPAGGAGKKRAVGAPLIISGVIAAALSAAALCVSARIPVHSLAVILIVGMWQAVDWHSLKLTFTGGIKSIAVFIVIVLSFFFLGAAEGTIIAAAAGIAFGKEKTE